MAARVNFWPSKVEGQNSGVIKKDKQYLGIHVKPATSTKRGGKGFVKIKATVNWPKFEKLRITYGGGEHCQMASDSGVSNTQFALGSCDKDWPFPQFHTASGVSSTGKSTCVMSFQHLQTGHAYTNGGQNVGFFSCPEATNQVLEMGTECGTAQCSTGGNNKESFDVAK